MAVLGARMLEIPKRASETLDVLLMKQTGESASLAQIADSVGESIETALEWAAWWKSPATVQLADLDEQYDVKLNTDFANTRMPAPEIVAIISAVQAGLLTRQSAVELFKRADLVSEYRTADEELDALETEAPPLLGNPLVPGTELPGARQRRGLPAANPKPGEMPPKA